MSRVSSVVAGGTGHISSPLGALLIIIGLIIVLAGAYMAYTAYNTYQPLLPEAKDLSEAITNTAYELVNLIIKLGFLGVFVWTGSILLGKGIDLIHGRKEEK